jgi:hypothetical protein
MYATRNFSGITLVPACSNCRSKAGALYKRPYDNKRPGYVAKARMKFQSQHPSQQMVRFEEENRRRGGAPTNVNELIMLVDEAELMMGIPYRRIAPFRISAWPLQAAERGHATRWGG